MFVSAGDQQSPAIPIMEMDERWKAHVQQAPNCPRCASANTKFCYYNNYSLAQPRYFCKGCRRYWTKGGSLRNVPVGGGCSRTRRSRSKKQLITARNSPDSEKAGGGPHQPSHSPTSSTPEIDLAAVFARYLNRDQSVSQGHGFESSPPIAQDVQLAYSQNMEQGQCLFEQGWQEGNNSTTLGLESFDHGVLQTEDVFWSTSEDGSSLSSSGLTANWEPMAALYPASGLDDQFSVSANSLLSDINWSCFDLAGYGDFCRSAYLN